MEKRWTPIGERTLEYVDHFDQHFTQKLLPSLKKSKRLYSSLARKLLLSQAQFDYPLQRILNSEINHKGGHGQQDLKEEKKRKDDEGIMQDPKRSMICWPPADLFRSVKDSELVKENEINAQKDLSMHRSLKPILEMLFKFANQTANSRTYASRTKRWTYKPVHSIGKALDSDKRFSSHETGDTTTASTKSMGSKSHSWVVPRFASSKRKARVEARGHRRQRLLGQRYVHMYGR